MVAPALRAGEESPSTPVLRTGNSKSQVSKLQTPADRKES